VLARERCEEGGRRGGGRGVCRSDLYLPFERALNLSYVLPLNASVCVASRRYTAGVDASYSDFIQKHTSDTK
jgi:hypothetical protein